MQYTEKTFVWLKNFLPESGRALVFYDLELISAFLVLWGLFEGKHFRSEYLTPVSLTRFGRNVAGVESDGEVESLFKHFHERYCLDENGARKFDRLKLSTSTRADKQIEGKSQRQFIQDIISRLDANKSDKVCCLFNIILRYRNNIFHGIKEVYKVNCYQKEIDLINVFMTSNLEKLKSYSQAN
jgi:hypothetical protein